MSSHYAVLGIMNNQQLEEVHPRRVFILERYRPLIFDNIKGYPHPFPTEFKDQVPFFHAQGSKSALHQSIIVFVEEF